jgi:hypothetical protein
MYLPHKRIINRYSTPAGLAFSRLKRRHLRADLNFQNIIIYFYFYELHQRIIIPKNYYI